MTAQESADLLRDVGPDLVLTAAQTRCLLAVIWLCEQRGGPVTLRDVADRLGIHHSAAKAMLIRLRDRGYIEMQPEVSRTIRPMVRLEMMRKEVSS